jgi:hypothetical protein
MRTLNVDPFWRTSIGFDRLFDLMDESLRFEQKTTTRPAISCAQVRIRIVSRWPLQV